MILIDTGSTHNFLDPTAATKAQLDVNLGEQIKVRVTNDERIRSEGKLAGADFGVQGQNFSTDLFLLPLGDIVQGLVENLATSAMGFLFPNYDLHSGKIFCYT